MMVVNLRKFSGGVESNAPTRTLIETDQLKSLLSSSNTGNLTLLQAFYDPMDASLNEPDDPLVIQDKYRDMMSVLPGHIPGAKAFPLVAYSNLDSPYTLTCPTEPQFISIAKALDLRINDTFVCYDAGGVNPSCRLAWTLKAFGAKNVHVLNGTLQKWMKDGGELSTDYVSNFEREPAGTEDDYKFALNSEMIYTYDKMKQVVDELEQTPDKK